MGHGSGVPRSRPHPPLSVTGGCNTGLQPKDEVGAEDEVDAVFRFPQWQHPRLALVWYQREQSEAASETG